MAPRMNLLAWSSNGLTYWDLHFFLLIPTLYILATTKLDKTEDPIQRRASYAYVSFILSIAVAQAFVWDSYGANIGIWAFNPEKCTALGSAAPLPVEEVLWLFHHVVKAAFWQLKMGEWKLTAAPDGPIVPMPAPVRTAGNSALLASFVAGAGVLSGESDSLKCVSLVAVSFSPVFAVVWNLGSRYWRSHWRLFLGGWLPPGAWTVVVDCIGQQQNVWNFPPRFLSGINTLPDGLLKLDIASVYLVSTFAVTGTGAIILAAAEEFATVRKAGGTSGEEGVWDLLLFILHGAAPQAAELAAAAYPPSSGCWRGPPPGALQSPGAAVGDQAQGMESGSLTAGADTGAR